MTTGDWLIEAARRPVVKCSHTFGDHMFCTHCHRSAASIYDEARVHVGVDMGQEPATVAVVTVQDGKIVQISHEATVWAQGLELRDGRPHFKCRVCEAWTEWEGEIDEFDPLNHANVCGGSPRCCP